MNVETGLIYRNSKPHVRSIHAYFPSVVTMDNGRNAGNHSVSVHSNESAVGLLSYCTLV